MRLTPADIKTRKNPPAPLVCLTAYTTPMAMCLAPYVDLLLVGDSVGTVLYGMENTTSVTLEMMIAHGKAVMRAQPDIPVIVDMPYGTYEASPAQALDTARTLIEATGAHGVKLEGGVDMQAHIAAITGAGIDVMGHIGLLPQSVIKEGGYKIKGKDAGQIEALLADASAVQTAGAFAVVIEGTIAEAAAQASASIAIPTIGIGGAATCDGQILVGEDMLGLLYGKPAKFVKEYAALRDVITEAAARYAEDVRARRFPAPEHLYGSAA